MKALRNKKILKLFDYFKTSFKINLMHKELYKPQIIFLILRGALIFITGLSLLQMIHQIAPFTDGSATPMTFFSILGGAFIKGPGLWLLLSLLIGGLGSTYVEAGLYHMYASFIQDESAPSFVDGANTFFLSFLIGNLLILLFWVLALIPYLIASAITLTLGLILIPISVNALLMVWKASVVIDREGTVEAIKRSIAFGRANFIPASIFIVLKNALTSINTSGGSSNFNTSFNSNDFSQFTNPDLPTDMVPDSVTETVVSSVDFLTGKLFTTLYTIALGTITVASVLAGMIQMIFEIFFALTTVVIYADHWHVEGEPETQYIGPNDTDADMEVTQ